MSKGISTRDHARAQIPLSPSPFNAGYAGYAFSSTRVSLPFFSQGRETERHLQPYSRHPSVHFYQVFISP